MIVSDVTKVGEIGKITATALEGETDSFVSESAEIASSPMRTSLQLTMNACREALGIGDHFRLTFESDLKMTGSSQNAAAALAVYNLMRPGMKADGFLATGRFEDDKFHRVGDINEKALTADRYKLMFLHPKENIDILQKIRRDCQIAHFGNINELFKLVKVIVKNFQILLSNNLFFTRLHRASKILLCSC